MPEDQPDTSANLIISPLPTGATTYHLQEQLHDLQATTIVELFEVDADYHAQLITKLIHEHAPHLIVRSSKNVEDNSAT